MAEVIEGAESYQLTRERGRDRIEDRVTDSTRQSPTP